MSTTMELELRCRACEVDLPITEFSPHKGGRHGVRTICKKCSCERARAWYAKNHDTYRNSHLKRTFGITLDDYNQMLAAQGGVCAICGKPPGETRPNQGRKQGRPVRPLLAVDHDHVTGKVRGLLCLPCNRGIGFLEDDPETVRAALHYLERPCQT